MSVCQLSGQDRKAMRMETAGQARSYFVSNVRGVNERVLRVQRTSAANRPILSLKDPFYLILAEPRPALLWPGLQKYTPMNSSPHSPNRQSKGVCVDTGPTICLSDSSTLY
jgi:hypothetical protein